MDLWVLKMENGLTSESSNRSFSDGSTSLGVMTANLSDCSSLIGFASGLTTIEWLGCASTASSAAMGLSVGEISGCASPIDLACLGLLVIETSDW